MLRRRALRVNKPVHCASSGRTWGQRSWDSASSGTSWRRSGSARELAGWNGRRMPFHTERRRKVSRRYEIAHGREEATVARTLCYTPSSGISGRGWGGALTAQASTRRPYGSAGTAGRARRPRCGGSVCGGTGSTTWRTVGHTRRTRTSPSTPFQTSPAVDWSTTKTLTMLTTGARSADAGSGRRRAAGWPVLAALGSLCTANSARSVYSGRGRTQTKKKTRRLTVRSSEDCHRRRSDTLLRSRQSSWGPLVVAAAAGLSP